MHHLTSESDVQLSLFYQEDKIENPNLAKVMDVLNSKYGKNKVKLATVGNREKEWALVREHRSPRFTTQWDELLTVGRKTEKHKS